MILPMEIMVMIYDYSDIETRIKMNKIFKWSYYLKNPFFNVLINSDLKYGSLFTKPFVRTNFRRFASYKGSIIVLPSS
jgi:hypothetical protein